MKNRDFKVTVIHCPPRTPLKRDDYFGLFKTLGNYFII